MNRNIRHRQSIQHSRHGQRGAVLYVALIMLILLALLGIVGMQVAALQERMSASYRALNRAFQNTEALARTTECGLEAMNGVSRGCGAFDGADVNRQCDDGFDAGDWVESLAVADAPAVNVRQIEGCIIGEAEISMGQTQETGGGLLPIYQITVYQTDTGDTGGGGVNPSSASAIDTVFKL